MPRVIGITGLAGSGKSTVASILLQQYDFRVVKFADPLKDMLRILGLGPAELEGEKKGLVSKLLCGKSPRYAMQTLGTEWGRVTIGENIWSEAWTRRAKQWLLDGHPVVADDCRFENEVSAIKNLGGEIWVIRRPGLKLGSAMAHVSEAGIAARFATRQIVNDGTPADLVLRVADMMSRV